MPTARYYRLPDEKRTLIRDAVIAEFARVPFEYVSINQIIRNANISRGSFYTYFEDKEDALEYIFKDLHERSRQFMYTTLKENGGDYFDAWEQYLEFCLSMSANTQLFALAKNTLSSFRSNQAFFGSRDMIDEERFAEAEKFMNAVNMNQLRVTEPGDFLVLSSLLLVNLATTLLIFYQGEHDLDALRGIHRKGIDILKGGVLAA